MSLSVLTPTPQYLFQTEALPPAFPADRHGPRDRSSHRSGSTHMYNRGRAFPYGTIRTPGAVFRHAHEFSEHRSENRTENDRVHVRKEARRAAVPEKFS